VTKRIHLICITFACVMTLVPAGGEMATGVGDTQQILKEDFESYEATAISAGKKREITGQGPWQENAFGTHPANVVVSVDDPGNASQVLTSPGGGDHHNNFVPDQAKLQAALRGPVVVISFRYRATRGRGAAAISPGVATKYNPLSAVQLSAAMQLTLFDMAGTRTRGLDRLASGEWHEVRLVIEPLADESGFATVTVSHRNLCQGESEFRIDYGLNGVKVDLSGCPFERWTGIWVRLDGNAMLDDLTIRSVADPGTLPGAPKEVSGPAPPYEPILDHIIAPREAVDISGVWEVHPQKGDELKRPGDGADWHLVLVPDEHKQSVFSAYSTNQAWFRRTFSLPGRWQGQRIVLVFERICDIAEVYVNDQLIARTDDGYFPIRLDITDVARTGAQNTVLVGVQDPTASEAVGHRPMGWTWFYPNFSGIPFPVHVETHREVWVSDVFVQPSVGERKVLKTDITVTNTTTRPQRVRIAANVGDDFMHTVREAVVPANSEVTVTLKDPWPAAHLWWPHDPYLYYLDAKLTSGDGVVDALRTRFGFREVCVVGKNLTLNGRRFMHRRTSIIPYWGCAQSDWMAKYVAENRARGYVGSRLHGGPSLRMARTADELGWLVSPESGVNEPRGNEMADDFWPAAEKHLMRMVQTLRNSPSVIYWSVSNEFGSMYMPRGHEKGSEVNQWLGKMGEKMLALDPSRTVTFSGEIDMGGLGKHGPAPTLSYHYPWQPFKLHNMIPVTCYWLDEGAKPWPGIVWEKKKPLIFSEDLHLPYALKPPHGMSEYAGDMAYEPKSGQYEAIFDAYQMLAEGYYHAEIAGWNPWGVPEQVYSFGQVMPDYLIATREFNRTFGSGETVQRTVFVYNQLFEDLQCTLSTKLQSEGRFLENSRNDFPLNAGAQHRLDMALEMPEVADVQTVTWRLRLTAEGRVLTERTYEYTVFPRPSLATATKKMALVTAQANAETVASHLGVTAAVYPNIASALAANPQALVLAATSLSAEEGKRLEAAVCEGLQVLWIEIPTGSWLPAPVQMDARHFAAHAFIRAPNDPLLEGLSERDLQLWRPDGYVTQNTFTKPDEGSFDILLDAGSPEGLKYAPVLRITRGSGSFILCQMPLISTLDQEPAAGYVLAHLSSRLLSAQSQPDRRLVVMALAASPIRATLYRLAVAFEDVDAPDQPQAQDVLLVDASGSLSDEDVDLIRGYLEAGATIVLQRLGPASAEQLAPILGTQVTVTESSATQLIRACDHLLIDGISNDDLYWKTEDESGPAIITRLLTFPDDSNVTILTRPAALAVLPARPGQVVISQICWDRQFKAFPARSARIALAMLRNLNVGTVSQSLSRRTFKFVDLTEVANRGFHGRPDQPGPRGWFGSGEDDMRYFPVNRTGIDPMHNVPQPPEPFPVEMLLGGILFQPINPEDNDGRSTVVLGGADDEDLPQEMTIPVAAHADRLWMLGALSQMAAGQTTVAQVTLCYDDESKASFPLIGGVHLNGYQHYEETKLGRMGWSGNNPARRGVALYVWPMENPNPTKKIARLHIATTGALGLALPAVTLERATVERIQ